MAASPPPRPRAAPRSRRRLAIALGVLALLVLARVGLPELLRRLIESNASDALGRRVEVDDVDLGLVLGRVRIEGLAVGGPDRLAPVDPASAVVRCASLGARIAWLPLLTGRIHLREIALGSPMLRLERNPDGTLAPLVLAAAEPEPEPEPASDAEPGGGIDLAIDLLSLDTAELRLVRSADASSIAELRFERFALDDLSLRDGVFGIGAVSLRGPELQVQAAALSEPAGASPAEAGAAAAAAPAATPPPSPEPQAGQESAPAESKYSVKDLNIEGARFAWRLPEGEPIQAELELHARDLGLGGAAFPLEIRLTTDGAALSLEGQLALEPLRFDGSFRWEGVHLENLARMAPDAPVALEAGRSDGALEIALRLPPAPPDTPAGLQIHGDVRVSNLDLATADGALALRWKELSLTLASLRLPLGEATTAAPEVQLAKLALLEPQVDFLLEAKPAAEAAASAPPPDAAESGEPAAAPHVGIDVLEVTGGTLRFRDRTVRPPVETALRELRVRAQGLRWPERDVEKLQLTAKGQRAATLAVDGRLAAGAGDVKVELRQLPLAAFDPYAAAASGIKIDDGRVSLSSKLSLRADRMGAKSRLSLHQLSVSERESGWFQKAFGVPLDVALALLRDLQGDITLPVDVEQSAGGTQVGIAAAVASALRQALVGALAAPLKLLGGVAGMAGQMLSSGLEPIPMEPGQGALTPDVHERLKGLAGLLASRPALQLVLVGRADASDDPLLARRQVLALARADEPLPGEDELGFFERRRVRGALADADPERMEALDSENAAALERLAGHVQVSEEARQALALARAQAVAQALQDEHGASAEAVAGIETRAGAPGVEIELRAANE